MAKPLSAEERQRIVDLLKSGKSFREVADLTGRSWGSIHNVAVGAGVRRDVQRTKKATEARRADIRARMALVAEGLVDDAARLREQIFAPHIAFNFGGKDNTYEEHEIPEPTARDKQALMTSIGIALDKARLITEDTNGGNAMNVMRAWVRDVIDGTHAASAGGD